MEETSTKAVCLTVIWNNKIITKKISFVNFPDLSFKERNWDVYLE